MQHQSKSNDSEEMQSEAQLKKISKGRDKVVALLQPGL